MLRYPKCKYSGWFDENNDDIQDQINKNKLYNKNLSINTAESKKKIKTSKAQLKKRFEQ